MRCTNKMSKYHGKVKNNFIKCGIDPNAGLASTNRTRRQEPQGQKPLDVELREIDELYMSIETVESNTAVSTRGIRPTTPKSKAPIILQRVSHCVHNVLYVNNI